MKPVHLVVGLGELGSALREVLGGEYEAWGVDIGHAVSPEGERVERDRAPKEGIQTLHIALNYHALGRDAWLRLVRAHLEAHRPAFADVCSTVPPGTTALLGVRAVHSTTRGLHPNLAEGLRRIAKHVGGPAAQEVARQYARAGVRCVTHRRADTTEAAHIAHLIDYGIQVMSADARAAFCRHAGVDYLEAVTKYTDTHNAGFLALDNPSKVRMNLLPSGGRIGGHCVAAAAELAIEAGFRHPLVEMLASYNNRCSPDNTGRVGQAPDAGRQVSGATLEAAGDGQPAGGLE